MSYKRILVPVDGSPTAAQGMAEAIKLAREARGQLMLLHVVEEFPALASPESGVAIGPILEAMRRNGARILKRIAKSAASSGVRVQTSLVENYGARVADAIVAEAQRWKADLLVMGTHGRRGVKRMLLGSDAEVVVRYSPIPVLLIPARGRGDTRKRSR